MAVWKKIEDGIHVMRDGADEAMARKVEPRMHGQTWAVDVNGVHRSDHHSLGDAKRAGERIISAARQIEHRRVQARVTSGAMRDFGPAELELIDEVMSTIGKLLPEGHKRNNAFELATMAGLELVDRGHQEEMAEIAGGEA